MRNKYAPRKGGNTGRSTSSNNRSTPKKDSKPDESKGSSNHIFTCGKSEDCQKTHEHLMSFMRQNYDNGHDIASAMDNGEAHDFSEEMPKTTTPEAPSEEETDANPKLQHEHEDAVKSLEIMHNVESQEFVKHKQTNAKNVNKACTLSMQQCVEKMESQLKNKFLGLSLWRCLGDSVFLQET